MELLQSDVNVFYFKCRFIIIHPVKVMCLLDFATEFVEFLEFLISSKNSATNKA